MVGCRTAFRKDHAIFSVVVGPGRPIPTAHAGHDRGAPSTHFFCGRYLSHAFRAWRKTFLGPAEMAVRCRRTGADARRGGLGTRGTPGAPNGLPANVAARPFARGRTS